MTQQQKARQETRAQESTEKEAADLRSEQLDEDVACCLAEIDAVLEADEDIAEARKRDEKSAARREWEAFFSQWLRDEIAEDEYERQARAWKARYGHLFDWCCGTPVFDE